MNRAAARQLERGTGLQTLHPWLSLSSESAAHKDNREAPQMTKPGEVDDTIGWKLPKRAGPSGQAQAGRPERAVDDATRCERLEQAGRRLYVVAEWAGDPL